MNVLNAPTTLASLIDAVIVFTLVEGAALWAWWHWRGGGVAARDFVANWVSGLCLMGALHGFAHDRGADWVVSCLLAAGLAHGTDIWVRWRAARSSRTKLRQTA